MLPYNTKEPEFPIQMMALEEAYNQLIKQSLTAHEQLVSCYKGHYENLKLEYDALVKRNYEQDQNNKDCDQLLHQLKCMSSSSKFSAIQDIADHCFHTESPLIIKELFQKLIVEYSELHEAYIALESKYGTLKRNIKRTALLEHSSNERRKLPHSEKRVSKDGRLDPYSVTKGKKIGPDASHQLDTPNKPSSSNSNSSGSFFSYWSEDEKIRNDQKHPQEKVIETKHKIFNIERPNVAISDEWMDPDEGTICTEKRSAKMDYKYVPDPMKGKEERLSLHGKACPCCSSYYKVVKEDFKNENQESGCEVKRHLQTVSRHKFLHLPPSTPPGFWDLGFTPPD